MRLLVHLSDLHFGRVSVGVVSPLLEAVWRARPHLVVVSGDFVQNGTRREFAEAREFVQQLPEPRLMVPGNHDLPFLNLWQRWRVGLDHYKEYIAAEVEPFYTDTEVAVLGVNTARFLPLRGGRINEHQMDVVEQRLCELSADLVKVLVTHHPFDLGPTYSARDLVGRARQAMTRFAKSIDLMLAGHMHIGHTGQTAVRYRLEGRSAVFVQAGTATSERGRGEPNSFNVIRIDKPLIGVERHQWQSNSKRFQCVETDWFDMADEFMASGRPFCPYRGAGRG